MAKLVLLSAGMTGRTHELKVAKTTVGRVEDNMFQIAEPSVSSHHCEIELKGNDVVVRDLNSTNGTFINGQRLTGQHILLPGEVVSLGEQINLLFEAVQPVDPNATMVSSAHISAPKPAVLPAQPVYAGQVPDSPTPIPSSKSKNNNTRIILVVVILLLLCVVCACGTFFWWVDATYRWCVFFPFLTGCG